MSKKRILITGAAGFVGSSLLKHFLHDGHSVSIFIKKNTNTWRIQKELPHINVFNIDIENKEEVENAIKSIKPEIIYHLATNGAYPFQNNFNQIIQTNTIGTWNLLSATAKHQYEMFINFGSSSEYGTKHQAMKEDDNLEPNSFYGISKASQSLLCRHFSISENLPITTFRLFSIYGPYEEKTRLISSTILKCLKGEDLQLSNPENSRDFTYIQDIIKACEMYEEIKPLRGQIINIATGVQHSIKDVVDYITKQTNSSSKQIWGVNDSLRPWDSKIWVSDCSKCRNMLKWNPDTNLYSGLDKTIEWYIKNGNQ